ncbi:MAG: radical SAM protein [Oscillospiraceae bacterium]|nr:radical SAM protein [Oscillospiraceae bacterium]
MKHSNIAIFIPHIGCPNMCSFCNQRTISGTQIASTADEVKQTLSYALSISKFPQNTEIAFFGGSFTAIDREYMLSLLDATKEFVGKDKFMGIRISTRPDFIDDKILLLLKEYNVTSIELGVQSLDDDVLKANRRGHDSKIVDFAVSKIKEYGFSLGLQMMIGLYKDTEEKLYKTAQKIIDYHPDTVRIYPTVVLDGTYLDELYKSGEYKPLSISKAVEICADLLLKFEKEGINVIRLGLHASESVGAQMTAGAYHPAFRELCENRIYLNAVLTALKGVAPCKIEVEVARNCTSKLIGQNRRNLLYLHDMGYDVKVVESNDLKIYEVKIKEC